MSNLILKFNYRKKSMKIRDIFEQSFLVEAVNTDRLTSQAVSRAGRRSQGKIVFSRERTERRERFKKVGSRPALAFSRITNNNVLT